MHATAAFPVSVTEFLFYPNSDAQVPQFEHCERSPIFIPAPLTLSDFSVSRALFQRRATVSASSFRPTDYNAFCLCLMCKPFTVFRYRCFRMKGQVRCRLSCSSKWSSFALLVRKGLFHVSATNRFNFNLTLYDKGSAATVRD